MSADALGLELTEEPADELGLIFADDPEPPPPPALDLRIEAPPAARSEPRTARPVPAEALGRRLEEAPAPRSRPAPVQADAIGLRVEEIPLPRAKPVSAAAIGLRAEPVPVAADAIGLTLAAPDPVAADAIGLALTEVESDPELDDLGLSLDDEPAQPPRVLLGTPAQAPRAAPSSPPPQVARGIPVAQGEPVPPEAPAAPAEPPIPMMEGIDLGRDSTALRPRKKAPPKPSEKRRPMAVSLEAGAGPEMDGFEGTGVGEFAGRKRQAIKYADAGNERHCGECGFIAPDGITRCTNCGARIPSSD